jgi:hypothetical protein
MLPSVGLLVLAQIVDSMAVMIVATALCGIAASSIAASLAFALTISVFAIVALFFGIKYRQ